MCEFFENQTASIAAMIPFVVLFSSWASRLLKADGIWALVISWVFALGFAQIGCHWGCGFLADRTFWECIGAGILVGAGANGLFSYDGSKIVLDKLGGSQPSVKQSSAVKRFNE